MRIKTLSCSTPDSFVTIAANLKFDDVMQIALFSVHMKIVPEVQPVGQFFECLDIRNEMPLFQMDMPNNLENCGIKMAGF